MDMVYFIIEEKVYRKEKQKLMTIFWLVEYKKVKKILDNRQTEKNEKIKKKNKKNLPNMSLKRKIN